MSGWPPTTGCAASGVGDTLPATYPHMLAFPLHLALMTDGSFPFPAIGLVHIYNRIVQHRPLRSGERAVPAGVGDAAAAASARTASSRS